MGAIIGICTANNRGTDSRVVGRSCLPFSLLDTSIQLCSSLHLRLCCKSERNYFVEENNLYRDCQDQRSFCFWTVANRYIAAITPVQTCDKLKTIMDDARIVAPHLALPKLHLSAPYQNCCRSISYSKVIPCCLPPLSTVSVSWIWWRHMLRLYNTLLPGLGLFTAPCDFLYAQFLMACFQHTFRCSVTYYHLRHLCFESSVCDGCNSCSSMNPEYKPFVSCHLSVQHQSETETVGGNSSLGNDFSDVLRSSFNAVNDFEVAQHRKNDMNVSCNKNPENVSLRCIEIIPNHINTGRLSTPAAEEDSDDDVDGCNDNAAQSWNKDTAAAHSTGTGSSLAESSHADEKQNGCWSFFVRASDSDASDSLDSDNDDGNDDVDTATSDESDNCCEEDDDSDADNTLTHCTTISQCFLIDLDPLKINGLYIPPTSIVPVTQSRCWPLLLDSSPLLDSTAVEVESESAGTLRRVNDAWKQCYSGDDVEIKSLSRQNHTKHVCIFQCLFHL